METLSQKDWYFVRSFDSLADEIHQIAISKGFWEDDTPEIERQNNSEKIALMHSELSECLEALRDGNPPDDKIPEFSGAEAELADAVIRIMDLAKMRGWRVAEAIVAKVAYNAGRPYKHGRLC